MTNVLQPVGNAGQQLARSLCGCTYVLGEHRSQKLCVLSLPWVAVGFLLTQV